MADPGELTATHHIFRHVKKTWTDGDFVEPAAFRLREEDGRIIEDGVSVNWVEYFRQSSPELAVPLLRDLLRKKRRIGAESKFALLNVGDVVEAAAIYCAVRVIEDEEPDDPSHALICGQDEHNDQVAEAISKKVITAYRAGP